MSAIEILANNKSIISAPFSLSAAFSPSVSQVIYTTGPTEYLELIKINLTSVNGTATFRSTSDIAGASQIFSQNNVNISTFNTPIKMIVPPNYRITLSIGAAGNAYFYGTKFTNSP